MLVTLYLNLSRLYGMISDYDKKEYYKGKMMENLGFTTETMMDEDWDDFDEDDFDDDEEE